MLPPPNAYRCHVSGDSLGLTVICRDGSTGSGSFLAFFLSTTDTVWLFMVRPRFVTICVTALSMSFSTDTPIPLRRLCAQGWDGTMRARMNTGQLGLAGLWLSLPHCHVPLPTLAVTD